ncbi:hypothetical protein CJ030_MR5G008775 [Morella rubra]|uniref:Uncharacterized protein n=1 Tax=Morella rubra TaxID=262757 RepID=A0A6A1WWY4_9ROSI|nr:hypothetical protein CJ030_MR5G008775 [Morella rubra]
MASKTPAYLFSTLLFLLQLHFSAGQTVVKATYWFPDSGVTVASIDSTLFTHGCWQVANENNNAVSVPAKGVPPLYPDGFIGYNNMGKAIVLSTIVLSILSDDLKVGDLTAMVKYII